MQCVNFIMSLRTGLLVLFGRTLSVHLEVLQITANIIDRTEITGIKIGSLLCGFHSFENLF